MKTWKEIKDKIESQGVKDDTEILYIDADCEYIVTTEKDGLTAISG